MSAVPVSSKKVHRPQGERFSKCQKCEKSEKFHRPQDDQFKNGGRMAKWGALTTLSVRTIMLVSGSETGVKTCFYGNHM